MTVRGARSIQSLAPSPAATVDWLLGDQDLGDRPGPITVEAVPHAVGSPATHGVYRIRGAGWSLFCKVLHHLRHWPALAMMPPAMAEQFAAEFPWRSELELWHPAVLATLPPGLRAPELHRVIELGDDRIAIWQEDVDQAPAVWDLDRFGRAAHLLGRWNARSTTPEALAVSDFPVNFALRMYAERAVPMRGLAPLADDALWAHPWLIGHADVRTRLIALGPRIPDMLAELDAAPMCLPHGDASPQNLLVPAGDDPAEFVVIDVSFRSPHALGFDLGQLLVGLVHAGERPAADLPAVAARIQASYAEGLAAEGVDGGDVARQFALSVMLRSGFDALLYDLLDSPDPADRHAFDERLALTRFLLDQVGAQRPARG